MWWDDWDLEKFIEEAKDKYTELDKNLGGWLPGGQEPQGSIQDAIWGASQWANRAINEDLVPAATGVQEAWTQAWEPTAPEGEYLSKVVRDVPGIGGATRALEIPMNLMEQASARGLRPFWGAMQYNDPNEVKWRAEGRKPTDWWQIASDFITSKPGEKDTVPASLARMGEGWAAMTGTPAQQEEGRRKFAQLSTAAQMASIPFDPVNYINMPFLTGPKKAAAVARAITPITEISRLDRFLGSVPGGIKTAEQALALPLEALHTANPIEKVPGLGKIFGRLSGPSKVQQDLVELKDTLGSVMADYVKQGEKVDLVEAATTVGRIVNPMSQEAEAVLGASRLAPEKLVARKMMEGLDTNSVITNYEKGQVVGKQLKAMEVAKAAGQVVDEVALTKLKELAKTLPGTKMEAMANFGRDAVDYGAKVSAKAHNVGDENAIQRLAQGGKNVLAYAFLAANPNYPVQNLLNNATMTILAGLNPFAWPGRARNVLTREGLNVMGLGRESAAMGMADVPIGHKILGGMMSMAQGLEKIQSENLFTRAFAPAKSRYMGVMFPKNIIPQDLVTRMAAVDQRLPGQVYDILRHKSVTATEAVQLINKRLGGKGLPSFASFLSDSTKNDEQLMGLVTPMLNRLERQSINLKNIDEVAPVIQSAVKQIDDWLARVKTPTIVVPPVGKAIKGAKTAKVAEPTLENARTTLVTFLDRFEEGRATAFTKTTQMAENWTGTPSELVAAKREVWNGVWQDIADLVSGVTRSAEGYADEGLLNKLRKTFADWANEAKSANYEYELALREFGHDNVRMDAEAAQIFAPYTARMKSITSRANDSLYRLMEKILYPEGIAAEKKALFTQYWDNVFKGVPGEEDWIKSLNAQISAATKKHASELEIKAIRDNMNAGRLVKANAWNKTQKSLRQKLFGEATPQAVTPVVPKVPIVPKPSLPQGQVSNDPYLYMADESAKVMKQSLAEIERGLREFLAAPPAGTLDAVTRKELINWVNTLKPQYTDARSAAIKVANFVRDFGMLNYTHRYEADTNLALGFPFIFWLTQTGKNMLVRYAEQPGLFFAYAKAKEMWDKAQVDIPARLQGMMRFHLPFAPDWMGDQFLDPTTKALPFQSFEYPLESAQWAEEGQNPAATVLGGIGGLSPFLSIPRNLLGIAGGKPEDVGALLPLTRQVQGASAIWKEAGLPGAGNIPAGGVNIETLGPGGGIRGALRAVGGPTVPDVDKYENYRVDRMLANMAKMGEITEQEATLAIRDKKGPIWDRATQKVGVEMGFGQLPFLSGAVQLKTYPKGEENLRADKAELDALVMKEATKAKGSPVKDMTEAWEISDAKGLAKKGTAISQWYADHPAYSVRTLATTPAVDQVNRADTSLTWDVLNEGTIPNKWKTANLSKEEQAALQSFYDKGNKVDNLTPQEKTLLQGVLGKIEAARGTPEFQNIVTLGKEINDLIDQEFARLGGPTGETNKYDWITKANGGKTTAVIAKWYADHPEYSNYGKTPEEIAKYASTYPAAGAGKDPVLYAEITALIDSEFTRLGGPAGMTDKYGWIKTQNGGKITPAISKWYQDHPGYSTSYTSTYKPYTPYAKAAFKVYPGKEWSFFKKWAPQLVKALTTYFKTGKLPMDLAQKLYEVYANYKGVLSGTFEQWVKALMVQSGVTQGV